MYINLCALCVLCGLFSQRVRGNNGLGFEDLKTRYLKSFSQLSQAL